MFLGCPDKVSSWGWTHSPCLGYWESQLSETSNWVLSGDSPSAPEIYLPRISLYPWPMIGGCDDKKATLSSLTGILLKATLFPDMGPRLTSLHGCFFNCLQMYQEHSQANFCQLSSQESSADPKVRLFPASISKCDNVPNRS